MKPIVFLHNPKAGGTSLSVFLRNMYQTNEVAPVLESSASARCSDIWLDYLDCKFIAGHFGHEVREQYYPTYGLITNFRHPFDRILSLYRFWKFIPESQFVKLPAISGPSFARRMSFNDFVRSDEPFLSKYINNFHTRQLVRSGWDYWKCDDKDFEIAAQRIDSMDWFFVCELPIISIAWLNNIFPQVKCPIDLSRMNQTIKTSTDHVDIDLIRLVLERNHYDMKLYQMALRIINKKTWGCPMKFMS